MNTALKTVIACSDALLYADVEMGILCVSRSPVVSEDSDLYEPVRRFLSEHEHHLLEKYKTADEFMMFGEREISWYRLK